MRFLSLPKVGVPEAQILFKCHSSLRQGQTFSKPDRSWAGKRCATAGGDGDGPHRAALGGAGSREGL